GTVMSAASAKKVGVPSGACVIARTTAEATRQTPPARTRREMRNDANAKCKMRNAKMRMGDGGWGGGSGIRDARHLLQAARCVRADRCTDEVLAAEEFLRLRFGQPDERADLADLRPVTAQRV